MALLKCTRTTIGQRARIRRCHYFGSGVAEAVFTVHQTITFFIISSAAALLHSAFVLMDPLTICATVTGLVRTCGTAATMCSGLITKYKIAPMILASIRTECTTVKTALSYVDCLIKQDADQFSSRVKAHSPLSEIFDVPLTGCVLTFSLLDVQLQKLYDRSKDHDSYKWKDKMKYVWDEDQAKAILDHMRGLQGALNLMLTVLQTYVSHSPARFRHDQKLISRRSSISALIPLLQEQKPIIEQVKKNTRSIRESLSSQFDFTTNTHQRAFSEMSSFLDSNIGDEEFSFDDEIINTFAYRNAIKRLASKAKAAQQNAKPDERHILDEPLIDFEESPQIHSDIKAESTASSSHQCLAQNITSTHTAPHDHTVMKDLKPRNPISIVLPSQPKNEGSAPIASSSCTSGSSDDIPVYLGDKIRDANEVTRQLVRDDEYRGTDHVPRRSTKSVAPRSSQARLARYHRARITNTKAFEDRNISSSSISTYSSSISTYKEESSENENNYSSSIPSYTSEYGKVASSNIDVKSSTRDSKLHEEMERTTNKVMHKNEVPSRRTRKRTNGQNGNEKRGPTATEVAADGIAADILPDSFKSHEREIPRRRQYRNDRVQDNSHESGGKRSSIATKMVIAGDFVGIFPVGYPRRQQNRKDRLQDKGHDSEHSTISHLRRSTPKVLTRVLVTLGLYRVAHTPRSREIRHKY